MQAVKFYITFVISCLGICAFAAEFDADTVYKVLSRRLDEILYDTMMLKNRMNELERLEAKNIGLVSQTTSIPTTAPKLIKDINNDLFELLKRQIRKTMTAEKTFFRKWFADNSQRNTEFVNNVKTRLGGFEAELNDKSELCKQRIDGLSLDVHSLIHNFTIHTTDECSADPSPCHKQATCKNTDWSYACTCNAGYKGDGSDCTDVNECEADPSPCHAGATCQNNDGSYTCTCKRGFIFDGTKCIDVNECAAFPNPCQARGTCLNNDGSYTCNCSKGYLFDGITCTDVNECVAEPSPCHTQATCRNNDGSYTCTCNTGYTGHGSTCLDINECFADPSPCHTRATCRNNDGSYTCTCNIGYQGDGSICRDAPNDPRLQGFEVGRRVKHRFGFLYGSVFPAWHWFRYGEGTITHVDPRGKVDVSWDDGDKSTAYPVTLLRLI